MRFPLIALSTFLMTSSAMANSLDFALGKALFDRPWTSAPASTQATDGLGPLFNARSCLACHPKNGRGQITVSEDGAITATGFLIRLGSSQGAADPIYGRQLQTNAIQGHTPEARLTLSAPDAYTITDWAYGSLQADTHHGGRLAQPLKGLGLLEQVPSTAILALADPDDANGDGISGRPHWVETPDGTKTLGRFAWKATTPTLLTQTAHAFRNDIGMSSPLSPDHAGDCTPTQHDCMDGPHGDSPQFDGMEISQEILRLVTHYLQHLPAPKPKQQTAEGLRLFTEVGCAACHTPNLPLKSGQTIAAYTDLLLHDMGDRLNDGIGEGDALPQEWRTPPLWGLSTAQNFLHDGRATDWGSA